MAPPSSTREREYAMEIPKDSVIKLLIWAGGRWGIGIPVAAFFGYLLMIVYSDFKTQSLEIHKDNKDAMKSVIISNEQTLTAYREQIKTNQQTQEALNDVSRSVNKVSDNQTKLLETLRPEHK